MVVPDNSIIEPNGTRTPIPTGPNIRDLDPEKLFYEPGSPSYTGGRGGSFSQILSNTSRKNSNVVPPRSPQGKEMVNRLGPIHEGFEQDVLGKGMTHAQRARGWGRTNMPATVKEVGSIGSHISPEVILRENNIISTLGAPARQRQHLVSPSYDPNPALADEVKNSVKSLRTRTADNSWNIINRATGGRLPEYGQQRLSRHAIRRIQENIKKGLPEVWTAPPLKLNLQQPRALTPKPMPKAYIPPKWNMGKVPQWAPTKLPALIKTPSALSRLGRLAKTVFTRGR
jgi:hypothetical protein